MEINSNQLEPVNQNVLAPDQMQTSKSGSKFFLIVLAVTVLTILAFLAAKMFLLGQVNQPKINMEVEQTSNVTKDKKIVAVSQSKDGLGIITYDQASQEKKTILKIESGTIVNELKVAPDGLKLYYIPNSFLKMPNKIIIIDAKGTKREVDFARSELWSLNAPSGFVAGGGNSCFWSNDGSKLACSLIERKSQNGPATGRLRISVWDYSSGSIEDVFTNDQIASPEGSRIFTHLRGWVGGNKLLVIQTKNNIVDIEPADFYTVDIKLKSLEKEFSYPYDESADVVITPQGNQIFFDSFSRIKEDKFVKYDFLTKSDTILASSKDVLGSNHPIISEDGLKIVFTTDIFLKSVEEMAQLKPGELKGTMQKQIHIYNLADGKEKSVLLTEPFGSVEALFSDGETFVVNSAPDGSVLFNSKTQKVDSIGGQFVGLGYF